MNDWEALTVLSLDETAANKTDWFREKAVFPAETCARYIYVGLTETFKSLPSLQRSHGKTKLYSGASAYQFLMEFFVGLKSSRGFFDENVSGQFKDAWKRYVKTNEDHRVLKPYIDRIFHDGSLLKSVLTRYQRRPTEINTAIEMAKLTPEKEALVVCGAVPLSVEMLVVLGTKKKINPGIITATHPDKTILEEIRTEVGAQNLRNSLHASIQFVPMPQALSSHMLQADVVMVCLPMATKHATSTLQTINSELCCAWKKRNDSQLAQMATLIHLKGCPELRGDSTGPWLSLANDKCVIPFTEIRKKTNEKKDFIKRLAQTAQKTVGIFCELRMAGDRPKSLAINPTTMEIKYTLGQRPLRHGLDTHSPLSTTQMLSYDLC